MATFRNRRTGKMPLRCILAALLGTAGCFAVWSRWRGASVLWLIPAALSLAGIALPLAVVPKAQSGRSFAICGGVCIAACVLWLWSVDGAAPTDLLGAGLPSPGRRSFCWARAADPAAAVVSGMGRGLNA